MSSEKRMLTLLLSGEKVGTDNKTCAKLGTNQVPDIARRIRNRGVDLRDNRVAVTRFGKKVQVKEYYLPKSEISRLQKQSGAQL